MIIFFVVIASLLLYTAIAAVIMGRIDRTYRLKYHPHALLGIIWPILIFWPAYLVLRWFYRVGGNGWHPMKSWKQYVLDKSSR